MLTKGENNNRYQIELNSADQLVPESHLLRKIDAAIDFRFILHVWAKYVEEADHLRHVPMVKGAYKRRKETIERVFADAKEKHGMRYTRLRGLGRVKMEVTLTFACMNLKKLANIKGKRKCE